MIINYIKNLRKKPIDKNAGFINGYYINRKEYKKVYDAASKYDRAWKTPIFLKSLIHNPSLLLLQEEWIVDENAFNKALVYFKTNEGLSAEVERLSYLFKKLNNITFINLQDYLLEKEDINQILETMEYYSDNSENFKKLINPLKMQYKEYAYPDNFEFEKMNAGIIMTLSKKYPNLILLDDVLRSPVYEDLELVKNKEMIENINIMKSFISASTTVLKPIPYIPRNWTADDYIKIHKSKGAEQIREVIQKLKNEPDLTQEKVEQYIQRMNNLSKTLSPNRTIIYSLGGLTAGVAGAVASFGVPWLFAASVGGAAVSGHQLIEGIKELSRKSELSWLNLSSEIAKWNLNSA